MKVLLIQDLDPLSVGGGAQVTDRNIIYEGLRRDHQIKIITPFSLGERIGYDDLAIFSNCVTFRQEILRKLSEKPFVIYTHDFYVCRWRSYFPWGEKCKNCIYLPRWREIYKRSRLNIFMSPLHFEAHCFIMPELKEHPYALIPSAFSPAQIEIFKGFRNSNPYPNMVLGVNALIPYKGGDQVLEYAKSHPELRFSFVGQGRREGLPINCNYLGPQTEEELMHMYAIHHYLIHLPSNLDPCSRVTIEGILSGRELIANRNIGLFSYFGDKIPEGKEVEDLVSTSARRFWEKIEEVI